MDAAGVIATSDGGGGKLGEAAVDVSDLYEKIGCVETNRGSAV